MDYAIYKTIDGQSPRIVHRITQAATNHRALKTAQKKLDEMRNRAMNYTAMCRNLQGTKYDFEYDFFTSSNGDEVHIRFYIEPLKN